MGVMGEACVFLNNVISPVTVELVGLLASQLAEVVAVCEACENTPMDLDLIILTDVLRCTAESDRTPETLLCLVAQISSARRALGSTGEGCHLTVKWA